MPLYIWEPFVFHVLWDVFNWPNGIVVGNLLAEVLVVAFALGFRDRLMKRFVAFHHKHKSEHEARLNERESP